MRGSKDSDPRCHGISFIGCFLDLLYWETNLFEFATHTVLRLVRDALSIGNRTEVVTRNPSKSPKIQPHQLSREPQGGGVDEPDTETGAKKRKQR